MKTCNLSCSTSTLCKNGWQFSSINIINNLENDLSTAEAFVEDNTTVNNIIHIQLHTMAQDDYLSLQHTTRHHRFFMFRLLRISLI